MSTRTNFAVALLATAVVGSLSMYGCGSGGGGSSSDVTAPAIAVPVAAANSPFIGVVMKVTCADGTTGQGSVGSESAPGEGAINVAGTCRPPIRIEAVGVGRMRPLGALAGGSEDVVYDPAVNLPVSAVLAAIPITPAPVNPLTTLVALQVTDQGLATESSASLDARMSAVASALGLAGGKSDLDKDYRKSENAAAATTIVEVAALAAANAAANGMPAPVTSSKTLGQVIAEGLANQAKTAAANSLATAAGIAEALKAVDPKLDVATDASLPSIDSDAIRVNNLVVQFVPASTDSQGMVNALIAIRIKAATDEPVPTPGQTQLIADGKARQQHAAQDSVRNSAARMVADVTVTTGVSTVAVDVARAAAAKLITGNITSMQQTDAVPADIAAQAKVVAEIISVAIKADTAATTGIFDTTPALGIAGAGAGLVGQVEYTAVVKAVTASSTTPVNTATAGADALKVATAVKDIVAPAATDATTVAAFLGAVAAVAAKVDPVTVNVIDAATKTNLAATVNTLQTQLVISIGPAPTSVGAATELGQQAGLTQLGGTATKSDFATPPALGSTPPALPTTTTTSSTSSTNKLTTTTTAPPTTTTTAAATTTTAGGGTTTTTTATTAPTTTTTAATTTTTAGGGTTTTSTATTAPTTTTTAATTTTTASGATTTTSTATTAPTTSTTVATTTTTAGGGTTTTSTATTATTTTTTTVATTTTTTAATFICQVKLGSASGFVTGVTSASRCNTAVFSTDGGGAAVTVAASVPAGATSIAEASLATCNPFGAPPDAGATSLTPCKI